MSKDTLYTVPQLSKELDITERAIRFYESKGLVKPSRAGNTRIFNYKDRARLLIILRAKKLGFSLAICCPESLQRKYEEKCKLNNIAFNNDLFISDISKDILGKADVILTDTWESMGEKVEKEELLELQNFTVSQSIMDAAPSECLFMHCLPANRNQEVEAQVIDGPSSRVWQEAENRLPTTIIYQQVSGLTPNILGENKSAAIRIVKDDFCKHLIKLFGKAIVSTSANISGSQSPKRFSEISDEIKKNVDYIVSLRQNELMSTPSTILMINKDGSIKKIR